MSQKNLPPQRPLSHCYIAAYYCSVAMFFYFLWLAKSRNVDGDEGLYLEAARLVGNGKSLYFDFFYQQMPLLPYLYAGWVKIFGFNLYAARYFSALLTSLAAFFSLLYVAKRAQNILIVYFCAALLFSSGVLLAWAPVVKTHPLNLFCLTLSTVLLLNWKNHPQQPLWMVILAGISIGIGFNARLLLAAFIPLMILYILFQGKKTPWVFVLIFCLMVGMTSIPTLYFFIKDPGQFIRFNFTYHTSVFPGIASAEHRLKIAEGIFAQPNFLILLVMAQVGILIDLKKEKVVAFIKSDQGFLTVLLLAFVVVHMASAEPFTQYFSAMVPLLVLASIPTFEKIFTWSIWARLGIMIPLLVFYFFSAPPQQYFEIESMGSADRAWDLNNIEGVVQALRPILRPGEPCLAWWSGYAFLAGCEPAPGMENHMRNHAIEKEVPQEVLEQYKMLSDEQLMDWLDQKRYRVLIDSVYRLHGPLTPFIEDLLQRNYRSVYHMADVTIYVANSFPNQ